METEVTRQMWADLKASQSSLPPDPTTTCCGYGMNNPVQSVTWYEAVLFANLLSQQRGLQRVYYEDSGFTTPITSGNYQLVYANWSADGYRLPTEGEWEYFARAGTTGPFSISEPVYNSSTYDNCKGVLSSLDTVAWFCSNSGDTSHAVGSKAPNPWGLKDVHGNAFEWVWDWYGNSYTEQSLTDYRGSSGGSERVVRGGYWNGVPWFVRSAFRGVGIPYLHINYLGFRLLRSVNSNGSIPVEFYDSFDGKFADSNWVWHNEDSSRHSFSQRSGWLRIRTQYGGGISSRTPNVLLRPRPDKNFKMQTRIQFEPSENHHSAGLVLWRNDNEWVILHNHFRNGVGICVQGIGVQSDGIPVDAWIPNNATDVYFKIEANGNTIGFFWSENGSDWKLVDNKTYSCSWISNTDVKIGLFAVNGTPTVVQDKNADFDFFSQ